MRPIGLRLPSPTECLRAGPGPRCTYRALALLPDQRAGHCVATSPAVRPNYVRRGVAAQPSLRGSSRWASSAPETQRWRDFAASRCGGCRPADSGCRRFPQLSGTGAVAVPVHARRRRAGAREGRPGRLPRRSRRPRAIRPSRELASDHQPAPQIAFDGVEIDPAARSVGVQGGDVTQREFDLLLFMAPGPDTPSRAKRSWTPYGASPSTPRPQR